ncbi:MAG: NAD-dependent epimerase/dehydratase family protein [bacterium]|nr:NAD-dependent epimerase/dehydratase family protein [bacterium]
MIKVGITGNTGFLGQHLSQAITSDNELSLIPFSKEMFLQQKNFNRFVNQIDCLVHLAAVQRDQEENLLKQNLLLTNTVINSLKNSGKHLIFASSIQENINSAYGRSKKQSRELFIEAAQKYDFAFSGLILPNVFGPGAKPETTSVVATFCDAIAKKMPTKIIVDKKISFIYVDDLIKQIISIIKNRSTFSSYVVQPETKISVKELLNILEQLDSGKKPENSFEEKLNFTLNWYSNN